MDKKITTIISYVEMLSLLSLLRRDSQPLCFLIALFLIIPNNKNTFNSHVNENLRAFRQSFNKHDYKPPSRANYAHGGGFLKKITMNIDGKLNNKKAMEIRMSLNDLAGVVSSDVAILEARAYAYARDGFDVGTVMSGVAKVGVGAEIIREEYVGERENNLI